MISPEDCQEIRERRRDGERKSEIVDDFDVSTKSSLDRHISQRCTCNEKRFGRVICPQDCRELNELYPETSACELAERYDCSKDAIRYHIRGECECGTD